MYDIESEMMSFNPNLVTNTRNNLNAWGSFANDMVGIAKMYAITTQQSYINDYKIKDTQFKSETDEDKRKILQSEMNNLSKTITNLSLLTQDVGAYVEYDYKYKLGMVDQNASETIAKQEDEQAINYAQHIIDDTENKFGTDHNFDELNPKVSPYIKENLIKKYQEQRIQFIKEQLKSIKQTSKSQYKNTKKIVLNYFNYDVNQLKAIEMEAKYNEYTDKVDKLIKNTPNRKNIVEVNTLIQEINSIMNKSKDQNPAEYDRYNLMLIKLKKYEYNNKKMFEKLNTIKV